MYPFFAPLFCARLPLYMQKSILSPGILKSLQVYLKVSRQGNLGFVTVRFAAFFAALLSYELIIKKLASFTQGQIQHIIAHFSSFKIFKHS